MAPGPHYDVVIVTDCRLPGEPARTVAEQLAAQHAAGFSSALLHVPSEAATAGTTFDPTLTAAVKAGHARLLLGDIEVAAGLLLAHHPRSFDAPLPPGPDVVTEHRLLIVDESPRDLGAQLRRYEPARIEEHLTARFGGPWRWAPAGPHVRAALRGADAPGMVTDEDWVEVVDVAPNEGRERSDAWHRPHEPSAGAGVVIGRHTEPAWERWPATGRELLAAYPDDAGIEVRLLGGSEVPLALLGELPETWSARGVEELDPRDLLAGLDAVVCFTDPRRVEATGREVIEAMAAGTPVVLPPAFEGWFGDAAVYAEPGGVAPGAGRGTVADAVHALVADRDAWHAQVARGRAWVASHASHRIHAALVAALLGTAAPATRSADVPVDATVPAGGGRRRVLLMSSNGAGVGHLMRLMSMVRRAEDLDPVFLTLSQAVGVVTDDGYLAEHLPSRTYAGLNYRDWHRLLHRRLTDLVREHHPVALIFDATHPYRGLLEFREDHPELAFVWSRRAMWQADRGPETIEASRWFDLVIEPGDLAEDADRGPTVAQRDQVVRVDPVLYLDHTELLDREAAARELGLDPDRPAALIQLGAGNINDTGSLVGAVAERLLAEGDLQVCVTRSRIARDDDALPERVHTVSYYPLARCFAAFDLAVAASGYNTFHELLTFGVPAAFAPNPATEMDDQVARAGWAADAGVATLLEGSDAASVDRALAPLLDADSRAGFRERMAARQRPNGAGEAATAIEALLAGERAPARYTVPGAAPEMPAGRTSDQGSATTGGDAVPDARARNSSEPTERRAPISPRAGSRGIDTREWKLALRRARVETRRKASRALASDRARRWLKAPFDALPEGARAQLRRRARRLEKRAAHRPTPVPKPDAPARSRPAKERKRPRAPVPTGTALGDLADGPVPSVLLLLPELDATALGEVVERVTALQLMTRPFAPLFVTPTEDFSAFRRFGFVAERLVPQATWATFRPDDPWPTYVDRRLALLLASWDVDHVLSLGGDGWRPEAALEAWLTSW